MEKVRPAQEKAWHIMNGIQKKRKGKNQMREIELKNEEEEEEEERAE